MVELAVPPQAASFSSQTVSMRAPHWALAVLAGASQAVQNKTRQGTKDVSWGSFAPKGEAWNAFASPRPLLTSGGRERRGAVPRRLESTNF